MIGQGSPFISENCEKRIDLKKARWASNAWIKTGLLISFFAVTAYSTTSKSLFQFSNSSANSSPQKLFSASSTASVLLTSTSEKTNGKRVLVGRPIFDQQVSESTKRDPHPFKLRFTWGGGKATRWQGTITPETADGNNVQRGSIGQGTRSSLETSNVQILSYRTDAPGSVLKKEQTIQIQPTGKVTFYAFQMDVRNVDLESDHLKILFQDADNPATTFTKRVSVKEILAKKFHSRIDSSGNGIWIQRVDGDSITFHSTNKREVFSPGDRFQVRVDAHLFDQPEQKLNFQARLVSVLPERNVIWQDSGEISLDSFSSGSIGPLSISAGPDPGVYQLEIEIDLPKNEFDFFTKKQSISRNWQWVVTGDPKWLQKSQSLVEFHNKNKGITANNRTNSSFDAMADYLSSADRRNRWESEQEGSESAIWQLDGADLRQSGLGRFGLHRIPRFPRIWPADSSSNKNPVALEIPPRKSHSLSVELPEDRKGPAILEVSRQSGKPIKLAISWLEDDGSQDKPKISGQAGFFRPDQSWVFPVVLPDDHNNPGSETLRRAIWLSATHKSGKYLLVLSNRSQQNTIKITKLKIKTLKPTSLATRQNPNSNLISSRQPAGRQIGRYLDVSGFFENFQAKKSFSKGAGSKVNDWSTIYLGTQRLVDFMQRSGTSSVWVPIRTQGGSLYPSAYSPTSPRSDDSIFNHNSHQTDRLDTVEFLLKSFQKKGLRLSPVVDFSGTSHAAEQLIAGGHPIGMKYLANSQAHAARPNYNPLHPKYQETILKTVEEIGQKYGSYESFSSLAIRLTPESNLLLPSEEFPLNIESFRAFLAETKTRWPEESLPLARSSSEDRYRWIIQNHRRKWSQWKINKLARFYRQIQDRFQSAAKSSGSTARNIPVYFVFDRWQQTEQFHSASSQALSERFDWSQKLLTVGLDIRQFQSPGSPGFIFSWRQPPSESFSEYNQGQSVRRDNGLWQELNKIPNLGIVSGLNAEMQRIVEPAEQFGTKKESSWESVVVYTRPDTFSTQSWSQALWHSDLTSLAHGSWGIPTVDQPQVQAFSVAFSKLPDTKFQTVFKDDGNSVVVRESTVGNQKFRYFLNAAPWPVKVLVSVKDLTPANQNRIGWNSLVSGTKVESKLGPDKTQTRQITLPPFSLASFRCGPDQIIGVNVTPPQDIARRLTDHKNSLFSKLRGLQDISPMSGLKNSGFEKEIAGSLPAEWTFGGSSRSSSVKISSNASHTEDKSLHLTNKGNVLWIRSESIPAPKTNRLSVTAWIRTPKNARRGNLRVSIDGRQIGGKSFYRYAEIGQQTANSQEQNTQWQPVVVHFDGIPSSQLRQLRVGFDLFGSGEVLIDSVQIFDRWIDTKGQKALASRLGLAAYALENRKSPFAGYQLLDHYWIDFLDKYSPNKSLVAKRSSKQSNTPKNSLQPIIKSTADRSQNKQNR